MSRRRKRKKESSEDKQTHHQANASSPPSQSPLQTPDPPKTTLPIIDEIEDLDDDFEEVGRSTSESKINLPTPNDKKEIRTIRRAAETSSDQAAEVNLEQNKPQKRQHLNKTTETLAQQDDELGSLEDEPNLTETKPAQASHCLLYTSPSPRDRG